MKQDDTTSEILSRHLNLEVDRLDRLIINENIFITGDSSFDNSTLEKSHKMVSTISEELLRTLKEELKECRSLICHQEKQIKTMKTEKDEYLKVQLAEEKDVADEMNKLFEYLRKSVTQHKPQNMFENNDLSLLNRTIVCIKNTTNSLQNSIDKSYGEILNKSELISTMGDAIEELQEQVRNYTNEIDNLNEERDYFKIKSEQFENQYLASFDEITVLQNHIKVIETERKELFDEIIDLKGGKANIQDYCSNLNGENNKLAHRIRQLKDENNRTFNELHNYIDKFNEVNTDKNELTNNNKNLEHAILKLRHECQNQAYSINIISRENESMKLKSQENEEEKSKHRRAMESMEKLNRDLEDNIYHVTSELQKLYRELSKVKSLNEENIILNTELQEANKKFEKENMISKRNMNSNNQKIRDLNAEIETLKTKIATIDQSTSKQKSLLFSYEKLLTKLLHQRREFIEKLQFTKSESFTLKLCSTKSIDFKDEQTIEYELHKLSNEISESFISTLSYINQSSNKVKLCEKLVQEFSQCIHKFGSSYLNLNHKRELDELKLKESSEINILNKDQVSSEILTKELRSVLQHYRNLLMEHNNLQKQEKMSAKKLKLLRRKLNEQKRAKNNLKIHLVQIKKELHSTTQSPQKYQNESYRINESFHFPWASINAAAVITLLESKLRDVENNRISINKKSTEKGLDYSNEKLRSNLFKVSDCLLNSQKDVIKETNGSEKNMVPEPEECSENSQEQKKSKSHHLSFTKELLEVLLEVMTSVLKAEGKNLDESFCEKPQVDKKLLFRQIIKPLKCGQGEIQRSFGISDLTNVRTVNDTSQIQGNEQKSKEVIEKSHLSQKFYENLNSVLKETHAELTNTQNISDNYGPNLEEILKSETDKRIDVLRASLEKAQINGDGLLTCFEKRKQDLKQTYILEKLNKGKKETEKKSDICNNINIQVRDHLEQECSVAKKKLDEDNLLMKLLMKKLLSELHTFQTKNENYKRENQKFLEDFMYELPHVNKTAEAILGKLSDYLNILNNDKKELSMKVQDTENLFKRSPGFKESVINEKRVSPEKNELKDPVDCRHDRIPITDTPTKIKHSNALSNKTTSKMQSSISFCPEQNDSTHNSYQYNNNDNDKNINTGLFISGGPSNDPSTYSNGTGSNSRQEYSNKFSHQLQIPPCRCQKCENGLHSEIFEGKKSAILAVKATCTTSCSLESSYCHRKEDIVSAEVVTSTDKRKFYVKTENQTSGTLPSPKSQQKSSESSYGHSSNLSIHTYATNSSAYSNHIRKRGKKQNKFPQAVSLKDQPSSHDLIQASISNSLNHQFNRLEKCRLSLDSQRKYYKHKLSEPILNNGRRNSLEYNTTDNHVTETINDSHFSSPYDSKKKNKMRFGFRRK